MSNPNKSPDNGLNTHDLVAKERLRQIEQEGWTPEHDDEHTSGSLALAAACYATPVPLFTYEEGLQSYSFVDPWPWDPDCDKRPYDGNQLLEPEPTPADLAGTDARIRQLVKASALLIAEIERLQRHRKALAESPESPETS